MKKHATILLRALLPLLLLCLTTGASGEILRLLPVMQLHQISVNVTMSYVLMTEDCVILIDAGTDVMGENYDKKPELLDTYIGKLGIDHIDAHIVTHWHNDHSYNIHYFNKKYATDDTVLYGVSAKKPERFVTEKGTYVQLKENDELDIGPFHIKVIGPVRSDVSGDWNDHSLNFIVTYGSRRFLFTGDSLNLDTRRRHAEELANIDVMQFPHHGLQPWLIDSYSLKIINPSMILLPGKSRGAVTQYLRESGIGTAPDIFIHSNTPGLATVLLCDGDAIQVLTDQAPGSVTRTDYPTVLERNTTAH